jgi:Probable zinc-ribbon domain
MGFSIVWFAKKGFQPPNTCDDCKRWKDSVSSEQVSCSQCRRNPRTYEAKQIIGANMLGDKSWNQVRSSYVCTDCYRANKKQAEPKVNIKCSFTHCLSPRGFFEMGQGQIDFFRQKGLTPPTACEPCRDWKKSVTPQRLSCQKCRQSVDFEPKTIIYQNQKGDVSWQQLQRSFECRNCKGAIKLNCENKFCQQEQQTRTKEFLFSQSDQEFYKSKGLTPPTTCKPCRDYKKTLKPQRLRCNTCRENVDFTIQDIVRQNKKGDVSWQELQRSFDCKDCKGAIRLTCSNNFCHQEKFTSKRSKEFLFSLSDQFFYKENKWESPTTCKPCREFKKSLGDQNIICSVCHRDQPVEAYEITMHCNVNLVPWDNCKHTFECSGCKGSDDRTWSPQSREWGKDTNYGGVKYRFKTINGKITDHMYSSPKFDKEQAHAQHVHFWQMSDSSKAGIGFAFDVGSNPPSESTFKILATFGFTIHDFVPSRNRTKYKLSLLRLWHIYGNSLEYNEYNGDDQFDIGIKIATAIINGWRKEQ